MLLSTLAAVLSTLAEAQTTTMTPTTTIRITTKPSPILTTRFTSLSSCAPSTSPDSSTTPTDQIIPSTIVSTPWMTTTQSYVDWTNNQDIATSDYPQSRTFSSTPRQDRQTGKGVGLYIGAVAGIVVVILLIVVAAVIICRRKKKHVEDAEWTSKPYAAADGDYIYAQNDKPNGDYIYGRNDRPNAVEDKTVDTSLSKSGNTSYNPYEMKQMGKTNTDAVISGGQPFDATPSAAILNANQPRIQSPTPILNSNVYQDSVDIYAVPMKKNTKKTHQNQAPEISPADETEIELVENDFYQCTCDDDKDLVDDVTYIVGNEIYDQSGGALNI